MRRYAADILFAASLLPGMRATWSGPRLSSAACGSTFLRGGVAGGTSPTCPMPPAVRPWVLLAHAHDTVTLVGYRGPALARSAVARITMIAASNLM